MSRKDCGIDTEVLFCVLTVNSQISVLNEEWMKIWKSTKLSPNIFFFFLVNR